MREELRFAGFFWIELERAAVRECVADADGPFRAVAFVIATEVAVSVDEIADRVGVFFERRQHFRAGRNPIRATDAAFEAETSQIGDFLFVKAALSEGKELGGFFVSFGFLVGDAPQRPKGDAT